MLRETALRVIEKDVIVMTQKTRKLLLFLVVLFVVFAAAAVARVAVAVRPRTLEPVPSCYNPTQWTNYIIFKFADWLRISILPFPQCWF